MNVHVTADFAAYDAAAHVFLEQEPVGNTVLLTIADMLRGGRAYDDEPPWFAWASDGDRVVGAACRTPPHLVAVATMPDFVASSLGTALSDHELPGAVGRPATVNAFALGAGRVATVRMRELQHVLTAIVPPPVVGGEPRAYTPAERALYVEWMEAFHHEAGLLVQGDPIRSLEHRLASGGAVQLWWADGEPVCLAGRSAPVGGIPRVGPVFTPPAHRRRGYAAALTAHLCAEALAAGAVACTLFADADNPTSNGVYERIGFTVVGTAVEAVFEQT